MSTTYLPLREAGWRHRIIGAALIALSGVLAVTLLAPAAEAKKKKPKIAKVMTRNLYLGADLSDAAAAASLDDLCDEAGEILRDLKVTNFPKRAKALSKEILNRKPDLVGLQEVAMWRTQTPDDAGPLEGGASATTVRYDFLKTLLAQLNKGPGTKYRAVVSREHFDFETRANEDGVGAGCAGSEIDGRLTMRDAILKRNNAGVKTSKPQSGTFTNLFAAEPVPGIPYPVKRGWVSINAKVRGSKPFKFIDTHFEAFDDGTIRNQQAQELVAGPGAGKGRKILVGDLNSDPTDPGLTKNAFNTVVAGGFKDRTPAGFTTSGVSDELLLTGTLAEFDRRIDHVLSTKSIKRVKAQVFGKQKVNGLYPSDHAGVLVALKIR